MKNLTTNILKILFLSVMIFLFSIVNTSKVYAAEVNVTLPTFDVTINEIAIENECRQYPFIVYKNITYFPMTYFDSRFLGLATEWDNLKGLEIYKTTKTLEYEPYKQNWMKSSYYTASIPKFNIVVNGKAINNSTEKYPLLSFRNVTYFPMTWRFAVDEFGWKYSFTSEDGLIINSTPPTLYADPSDNPWPLIFDRTFKIDDDIIIIQIKSYRIAYSSKLYISINGEEQRQLGDNNYVYGVTTYKDTDNNAIGMRSNNFMELKDDWLYINAFKYQEEDSSRLYKVNIKTGETVPLDESDNLNYLKISSYLQEESIKVFSPYYELLGFITFDYSEEVINGNIEAVFHYTIIHKNYDRDPDTVEYIKEAKERGDKNYQIYYDEYLKPKDMNFYFKAVISENDNITLYSLNLAIDDWYQVKMSDFIIGETANGLNSGDINMPDYEKLLIFTYLKYIQNVSDDFYKEYFTINPTVTYDYVWVKEIRVDGSTNPTSYITFTCMPFVGAHLSVGIDEITFSTDYVGNIELKEFKNIKNYSLPEHLKSLIIKPIPGEYEEL